MPPKQRITREMILEKSFEMFCRDGLQMINARSVAKALNCSTQPIFSYFSGMQDLKSALEEKAKEQFATALAVENQPGDPLVNLGCAYTRFAAEQPHLFEYLFLMRQDSVLSPFSEDSEREALVRREAEYAGLTEEQADALSRQMSVYIHGLAALSAAKKVDYHPDELGRMIAVTQDMTLKGIRNGQF